MKLVYLVVGCPGSGKTWVCDQIQDLFTYVHHDLFVGMAGDAYVQAILTAAQTADRPLLTESPFSISEIKEPLERAGLTVIPAVIAEAPGVIEDRYQKREQKVIPKGHITRQETYLKRALTYGWFHGTAAECLEYLRMAIRSPEPPKKADPVPTSSEWAIVLEKAIRPDGSLFFPERLTKEFLERARRQMGSYLFSNQYMNVIVPDEERKFRPEWLRYTNQIPQNVYSFGFIDPAIGQNKHSDYTGEAVVCVDTRGIWYLRHTARRRLTPSQIVNRAFDLCSEFKLDCLGIESVAYQQALLYLISEEMQARQKTIPIKDVTRGAQSKTSRILGLVPRFEWSRIFVFQGMGDFEEEYVSFPRGSHDDIMDALASLEELVYYPVNEEKKLEQPHSQNDPDYERWYRQQLVESANGDQDRGSVEREFGF